MPTKENAMKVRAKFNCVSIIHLATNSPGEIAANLLFHPAYGEANKNWSKYTPNGKLEITITNPDAIAAFELGKSYYLDFTPAD
jgi:hypothetical protein